MPSPGYILSPVSLDLSGARQSQSLIFKSGRSSALNPKSFDRLVTCALNLSRLLEDAQQGWHLGCKIPLPSKEGTRVRV